MKPIFISFILLGFHCFKAQSQTNVRAWNANGQVFIVWNLSSQASLTYSIHMSADPLTSTSGAILVGSVFEPEWKGTRLNLANPNARWRIPDANGNTYQLTTNEGLFVYTPHDTLTRYFYVTRNNDTILSTTNRTPQALFVTYNPMSDPVQCHLQFSGNTGQGFPYRIFAMWADGRNDPNDARPDFPVMANAAKNGAPHVFAVFEPQNGLPAGPYPAVVCLHGGGPQGSYWTYAPNSFHYGNTGNAPVSGLTVAFDDRLYISSNGNVSTDRPTNWFGWHTQLNATVPFNAPPNGLVVPYTLRRLMWTIDWIINYSSYIVDSNRIAVMGNSMGGTGTLLLSRWKPERFSAASAFVPPHYTPETAGRLFGTAQTNLKTTEVGPGGDTLRINDIFDVANPISPITRDYCLTRIYRGRCDDAAEWGSQHLQLFNDLNNKGIGIHLYWDNRDHTASDWTSDTPGDTCPDVGQWVSPVQTERCAAAYQSRFRSDQSYPGLSNDDQNFNQAGRQPELGNGSYLDGDAWGTWAGYYDWNVNTIIDTSDRWECTIFLTGQSPVSIDNYPGDSAKCDVTIRKAQSFVPQPFTLLNWQLIDLNTTTILNSGATIADSNGTVRINNLTFSKDPNQRRLIVENQSTTAIDGTDYSGDNLLIFPNPANNIVHVKGYHESVLRYQICNISGQTITTGQTADKTIITRTLTPGIYTLLIFDSTGRRTIKKLVINK